MNYQPVTTRNQTNPSAVFQDTFDVDKAGKEANLQYVLFPLWSTGFLNPQNKEGDTAFAEKEHDAEKPNTNPISAADPIVNTAGHSYSNSTNPISAAGPLNSNSSPTHGQSSLRDTYQPTDMVEREDIDYFDHENVGAEADFNNLAIGTKWVYKNKKDERGIVVRNKARLVTQGHTQEEGIDYEEVFTPVARIGAIRLFLAYASFMGFMVYKMDVKQKEDGIFINQDKYVAEILKKFRLTEGKLASTPIDIEKPLLKDPDGEDDDLHIYRSMIGSLMYLTSSRPDVMFAQTVVATSFTEAKYVAGASCCTQVLWIQNQMPDY
nr:hypothetical protein [Tanacetum cinerariifolium]